MRSLATKRPARTAGVAWAALPIWEGSCDMAPKTAAQMVAEARQRIDNLSVDEVAAELEGGSIAGMLHTPRGMLEFYADPASSYHRAELNPNARVVLYCASGGLSALAVGMLQQLGYTDVAHLDGGFNAWKAAGKPTQ